MVYSIIKKSQLEGAHRLDAEYYQPEYLEIEKKLKATHHKTLEEISNSLASFGAYELTNYIEWQDQGVPFVVAENIKEGFMDFDGVRYISEKVDKLLQKSRVVEGQVLLSMSGSVGNAAIAHRVPKKLNSNQDIVKITLKPNFSPYALVAFLNSKYGKMQVLRLPVGSVQQHIFLWQTKSLLVPIFSKDITQEVERIYRNGLQEIDNSKSLYSQAENLLLEELGLKNFSAKGRSVSDGKSENELCSVINFSDIKTAGRMDAEYFQPKYERIISALKAQKAKPLVDILDNVAAKFDPLAQPEKLFQYVELSNINSSTGIIDGFTSVLGKEAPSRAKRVLKSGDVIVSSVEGSLGKVALVHKEQKGYLASNGFFQFRSNELLPEVLLVIAKSFILQNQLEQRCAGTILTAVPKESIKDVLIPVLPTATQKKIADLVRKSHESRKKAKELLEEAKRKVEEMIEKSQ